jgi:hypothetical protein
MTSIIIYTTPEKLLHKQDKLSFEEDDEKSEVGEYYWELRNPPKGLKELGESKIYFATKGFIRGYFEIEDIEWTDNFKIFFYANSWKDIKPIPITHFQGFKYADKVKELQ